MNTKVLKLFHRGVAAHDAEILEFCTELQNSALLVKLLSVTEVRWPFAEIESDPRSLRGSPGCECTAELLDILLNAAR